MGEHLTFENMILNVEYVCLKYTPVYDRAGLYYVIDVCCLLDNDEKSMIITDGCIFDKLNKFRLENTCVRFSFKKIAVHSLNNNIMNVITIIGDHDSVILVQIFKY